VILLIHQVSYDLRASLRNPPARFFTFFFPVLLLFIFVGVFGHGHTTVDGVTVKLSRYYVPSILTLSIITAAYAGLVISVATARETGVLKRRRAAPAPAWLLIAGQALTTLVTASIAGTILLVIAKLAYHVGMPPGALVAIGCTAVVGTLHRASVRGSFTTAIAPKDLLVLGIWGLGAAALAAWHFSWLPSAATA
jgi:ABC-2 type transport system permease protein